MYWKNGKLWKKEDGGDISLRGSDLYTEKCLLSHYGEGENVLNDGEGVKKSKLTIREGIIPVLKNER